MDNIGLTMASDYNRIRKENELRYGTDIGRIGPMLLSDRYDNRIHFIFELLQNAEDALKRRISKTGSRSIKFSLFPDHLRVSHFGQVFSEQDVRGICGIGESTKAADFNSIGRFGIGFKAVYAFTDSPEIHSGDEHFAIDSYVWPKRISSIPVNENETVFILPFKKNDTKAYQEVLEGLKNLGPRTLLFLREIDQIEWESSNLQSGVYMRDARGVFGGAAREVLVLGQESGRTNIEERWLVFSRAVSHQETHAGYVEAAFQIVKDSRKNVDLFAPLNDAKLVVFFPTIVSLNFGFLVQGPYRTTPSRDNVPQNDPWNQHLVQETAGLVEESFFVLKDHGLMTVELLQTMPIESAKFSSGIMFFPLFAKVREALRQHPLLPIKDGGYAVSSNIKIARGQDLRDLFSPDQMMDLLELKSLTYWLHESITRERTPQLYEYCLNDLNIQEIVPNVIALKITGKFLEKQTDEWIAKFYLFLDGQNALLHVFKNKPIFRVENDAMEFGWDGFKPRVFLPSHSKTDFLTIKRNIYSYGKVSAFFKKLELREADLVDDAIHNVLPKYKSNEGINIPPHEYAADMERILNAFETNLKDQQAALVSELKESFFISAIDAGTGEEKFSLPGDVYLPTEKLVGLFSGVEGVLLINDKKHSFWRGEKARNFLEAVGASRRLAIVSAEHLLSQDEKLKKIRENGGEWGVWTDWDILGLDNLFSSLEKMTTEQRAYKAVLLWDLLSDVAVYRASVVFSGVCAWSFHRRNFSFKFDARFVNNLNNKKWIVGSDGKIYAPSETCFDSLAPAWSKNEVLLAAIKFKPSLINELERQVGLEPGVLSLLTQRGIVSVEALKKALGIVDAAPDVVVEIEKEPVLKTISDDEPQNEAVPVSSHEPSSDQRLSTGLEEGFNEEEDGDISSSVSPSVRKHDTSEPSTRGEGDRKFVSYVAVHGIDKEFDGEVFHEENMAIEDKAIKLILEKEPRLLRASTNNKGYDLFQPGPSGAPVKWVEVKAISGPYKSRPATLSKAQFELALKHGEAYWLYVVENVQVPQNMRIIRIQDPAGKAQSFTFDSGWVNFSEDSHDGSSVVVVDSSIVPLKERLVSLLQVSSEAREARELAKELGIDKMQVNKLLYGVLKDQVIHEPDNRWRIKEGN